MLSPGFEPGSRPFSIAPRKLGLRIKSALSVSRLRLSSRRLKPRQYERAESLTTRLRELNYRIRFLFIKLAKPTSSEMFWQGIQYPIFISHVLSYILSHIFPILEKNSMNFIFVSRMQNLKQHLKISP